MRKERIKKLTKMIHDYEHKIAHPPEVEDMGVINDELVSEVPFFCIRDLIEDDTESQFRSRP